MFLRTLCVQNGYTTLRSLKVTEQNENFFQKQLTNYPTHEWRGIWTPGIFNTLVFKTDSFNHSDIHPYLNKILIYYANESSEKETKKDLK